MQVTYDHVIVTLDDEEWTIYKHDVAWNRPDSVWMVDYSNGWSRRSVMNYQGQVLHTRWIKPCDRGHI